MGSRHYLAVSITSTAGASGTKTRFCMHICSAGGRFGDFPPKDETGFRDFVLNIGADAMHEAIRDAEVVSPFATIRYEYNRFRHYEELKNLPKGFLVIGDALCSVNPTYGQGMSSATLQAKELADILDSLNAEQGIDGVSEMFFPRAVDVATVIWRQANFNDLAYPKTEGDRTMFSEEEVAYNMALQILAVKDLDVRRTLVHVNHFLIAPAALRSGEIMQKVEALKTAAA